MSHLVLEKLEKRYGPGPASVSALDLAVEQGELVALLGPSGCGKTTTLRMIAGLIAATSGRIAVAGRDVTALPAHRRDMGIVFQNYALFPHMTVAGNVAFGLEMRKVARAEIGPRVQRALDMVRLGHLAGRRPKELSGGQQQRVALARALVIEPSILLLDEPLSNLDAKLRDEMRSEIRDIQQRLGITAIFVTHDQAEALAMCDRVAVMRAGTLEQLGTPSAIYEHPASLFVADFVGRTNRIEGERLLDGSVRAGGMMVRTAAAGAAPGAVTIAIRPHRIRLGPGEDGWNSVPGVIRRTTYVGDVVALEAAVADGVVLTVEQHTQPGGAMPVVGQAVTLGWRVEDTLCFPRC